MGYKEKREEMEWSQEKVARYLGISNYGYQLIERGTTKKPRPETLKKLNKLFGKVKND